MTISLHTTAIKSLARTRKTLVKSIMPRGGFSTEDEASDRLAKLAAGTRTPDDILRPDEQTPAINGLYRAAARWCARSMALPWRPGDPLPEFIGGGTSRLRQYIENNPERFAVEVMNFRHSIARR